MTTSVSTVNLPFGDINVVVLTDVHSWLASHRRQEPYHDADLGDVLSFWERLKEHQQEQCDNEDGDLFFVNNGDFLHGTGLSLIVDGQDDPEYLIPLLEKMPYDAVNVGNHELFSKSTIDYIKQPGGYIDWWGDRYLTSNINRVTESLTSAKADAITTDEKVPLGNRYKVLHGRNCNLLVFGFLFNMGNFAKNAGIEVERVQTVVDDDEDGWFHDALMKEEYDAILVLAHMDLVDPLVDVIRLAIRRITDDDTIPVVFVTGHTHHRGWKQLDNNTMTFEAGRYLDTVGFVSFPKKESVLSVTDDASSSSSSSSLFQHKFLDANREVLFRDTLGLDRVEDGETKDGRDLSVFIDETRKRMGLERRVGCAPRTYYANHPLGAPDSLWGLYAEDVIPKIFFGEDRRENRALLLSKGRWRYDLKNDTSLIVDDIVAIAAFNDTVVHLGTFTAEEIRKANETLNKYHNNNNNNIKNNNNNNTKGDLLPPAKLPKYILIGNLDDSDSLLPASTSSSNGTPPKKQQYHLYTHEFDTDKVLNVLKKIAPLEKLEIRNTEFRSTTIWLAFVEKYWPCDGVGDAAVDTKLTGQFYQEKEEMIDGEKLHVRAIAVLLVPLGILGMIFLFLRRRAAVHQPVGSTEGGKQEDDDTDNTASSFQDSCGFDYYKLL